MNTLSWLIYLCYVIPTLSNIGVGLIAGSSVVFCLTVAVLLCVMTDDLDRKIVNPCKVFIKVTIPVFLIGLLIILFAPDTKTMYLIAGSQAGEMVINTNEAKEIYMDIRNVIQSYSKE